MEIGGKTKHIMVYLIEDLSSDSMDDFLIYTQRPRKETYGASKKGAPALPKGQPPSGPEEVRVLPKASKVPGIYHSCRIRSQGGPRQIPCHYEPGTPLPSHLGEPRDS